MPARENPPGQQPRSERHRALKGARIAFNNHTSSFNCLVRNLSETGARLDLDVPTGLPERFDLLFDDGSRPRKCEIVRHSGRSLGVRFLD